MANENILGTSQGQSGPVFNERNLDSSYDREISTRYPNELDEIGITIDGSRDVLFTVGRGTSGNLRIDSWDISSGITHIDGLDTGEDPGFNPVPSITDSGDRMYYAAGLEGFLFDVSDETSLSQADKVGVENTQVSVYLTTEDGTEYIIGVQSRSEQIGFVELSGNSIVRGSWGGTLSIMRGDNSFNNVGTDGTRFYVNPGYISGYLTFDPSGNTFSRIEDTYIGMSEGIPKENMKEHAGYTDWDAGISALLEFGPTLKVSRHS